MLKLWLKLKYAYIQDVYKGILFVVFFFAFDKVNILPELASSGLPSVLGTFLALFLSGDLGRRFDITNVCIYRLYNI